MKTNNELIEHLLAYDVITEAEKITMHKYKEHNLTQRLAALNFVKRNQKLAKELKTNEDTYRSMRYLDYINVVISEGFTPVYNESFQGGGFDDKPITEVYLVFYQPSKGILLTTESFGGSMINKATMYYSWVPNQKDKEWTRAVASGTLKGLAWVGSHDVHEALRYKIELLQRKGYFCQWSQPHQLYLLNYVEGREIGRRAGLTVTPVRSVEEINKKKLSQFPEFVRKAIMS